MWAAPVLSLCLSESECWLMSDVEFLRAVCVLSPWWAPASDMVRSVKVRPYRMSGMMTRTERFHLIPPLASSSSVSSSICGPFTHRTRQTYTGLQHESASKQSSTQPSSNRATGSCPSGIRPIRRASGSVCVWRLVFTRLCQTASAASSQVDIYLSLWRY